MQKQDNKSKRSGFSLAEMMVVMLMVAVVLAATAPMVTRKVLRERSDKVFDMLGVDPTNAVEYLKGRNQRIYMNAKPNGYVGIRETGDTIPQNSVMFGYNTYTASDNPRGFVGIGFNTTNALNSISIGYGASSAKNSIAIGYNAQNVGSSSSGKLSQMLWNPNKSIAIGYSAKTKGKYATALGYDAFAINYSTAIGYGAKTEYSNTVVLGTEKDTVYIPGNLIVGKTTMMGAKAVDDKKYYPIYAKLRYGHDGDDDHITDIMSVIEHNHADDYKGGGDTPMSMIKNSTPGAQIGPYFFYTHGWNGDYKDNQKICPPVNGTGNWRRIGNGNCSDPSESADELLYSDIRLKNVGESFNGGLAELSKLNFYHYTFKNDETKTPHVGVMAQDLQKVFPDAVKEDDKGFLQIRLEDMFYSAINAIKELNTKLCALAENVQNIIKDVTDLKAVTEKQQTVIDAQAKRLDEQQAELKNLSARVEKLEHKKK